MLYGRGEREEGRRGDVNLCRLSKLALVTSVDVPLDVAVESGPPKAVEDGVSSRIDTFVTETVVGFTNGGEMLRRGEKELVAAGRVASPKSSVQ
jgi:hypothetical protein